MSEICRYKENPADAIIPRLYLGDYTASYNHQFIKDNNIKHVIRVMPEFDHTKKYPGVTYLHIPIKDNEMCSMNLRRLFNYTNSYISNILSDKNSGGILVHCKRGHHRSASVITAYLIKCRKMDYLSAKSLINEKRPCALRRKTCMVNGLRRYVNRRYRLISD